MTTTTKQLSTLETVLQETNPKVNALVKWKDQLNGGFTVRKCGIVLRKEVGRGGFSTMYTIQSISDGGHTLTAIVEQTEEGTVDYRLEVFEGELRAARSYLLRDNESKHTMKEWDVFADTLRRNAREYHLKKHPQMLAMFWSNR